MQTQLCSYQCDFSQNKNLSHTRKSLKDDLGLNFSLTELPVCFAARQNLERLKHCFFSFAYMFIKCTSDGCCFN